MYIKYCHYYKTNDNFPRSEDFENSYFKIIQIINIRCMVK